jgi:hypothetical protein
LNYTLDEAQEFYDLAKTAYKNALTNRRYDIAGRSKENQQIEALKKEMNYWKGVISDIKAGKKSGIKVKRVVTYV